MSTLGLAVAPSGALQLDHGGEPGRAEGLAEGVASRIALAFAGGPGEGLAHPRLGGARRGAAIVARVRPIAGARVLRGAAPARRCRGFAGRARGSVARRGAEPSAHLRAADARRGVSRAGLDRVGVGALARRHAGRARARSEGDRRAAPRKESRLSRRGAGVPAPRGEQARSGAAVRVPRDVLHARIERGEAPAHAARPRR